MTDSTNVVKEIAKIAGPETAKKVNRIIPDVNK